MSYSLCRMVLLNLFHHKRIICRVITSSILLLLVAGCASITLKDDLPSGTPKGFVKFYILKTNNKSNHMEHRPAIFSLDSSGYKTYEGMTSPWGIGNDETGLQIAKLPAFYTFSVRLGNADKEVNVRVEENKITPVRIGFSDVQERCIITSFYPSREMTCTKSFVMDLSVEDSIPVKR